MDAHNGSIVSRVCPFGLTLFRRSDAALGRWSEEKRGYSLLCSDATTREWVFKHSAEVESNEENMELGKDRSIEYWNKELDLEYIQKWNFQSLIEMNW